MKKITFPLVLLVFLSLAFIVDANPVNAGKATQVARSFLNSVGVHSTELTDITSQTPYREFYIFSFQSGFVIVSGDDCVLPVLGYSVNTEFHADKMPPHIADWLQSYEDQIVFYKRLYSSASDGSIRKGQSAIPVDEKSSIAIASQWESLTSGGGVTPPWNDAVSPLLTTTWNQSPYYNNQCPYDNSASDYAVTGCVATATAQIMKYWNHPTTGYGSHSYTHSYFGTLSANFGTTTYAWSSMPNSLSASSSSTQVNAVATLMYHIGVAVEMDYSTASSGASTTSDGTASDPSAENALKNYFKYSPLIHTISREDYTNTEWCNLLKNELDNNRPILYSGRDTSGGHAFVLDGYNASGQFHINWGWGSWCDGYYTMGDLHPAAGGTGGNSSYTFNLRNHAVVGIQPNNSFGGSTTITVSSNNTSYGTVTGGGSYAIGNTAYIEATAASGYRLAQWSDGYKSARREIYATGGTVTLTAQFEPLSGDTLSYCSGAYLSSLGGSGSSTWGIKLPASVLTSGHDLTKVQFYPPDAGTYNLTVYTGVSSASTTACTVTCNISNANADMWNTVTLPTPVTVDGTQSLWLTFTCSDVGYPAAMGYNSGNGDAMLWGSSFYSINDSWNYSWLIRGIFEGNGTGPGTDDPVNDTLSYCGNNAHATSVGLNSTTANVYWGIRIPASQLAGRNSIDKVLLYVPTGNGGTYTMNIYQGGTTAPQTLLYSQAYTFTTNLGDWKVCLPSSPVSISSSQDLWITFHNIGVNYPAAGCAYVGDNNSDWISLDGTSWVHCYGDYDLAYSWMIKCITSSSSAAPSINIQGPQNVLAGESATFTATATTGATITWTLQGASPSTATGSTVTATWNFGGTYNVIATATTSSGSTSDTLVVNVLSCNTVTTYPYTLGFEEDDNLLCMHFVDNDGDGYGWSLQGKAHTGSYSYGSASYINNIGALTPDNWMILPQMQFSVGNNYQLSWYTGILDVNYYQEQYGVYVSTTGTNPGNFTLVQQYTIDDTSWAYHTLDLSSYAGQTVYIAFCHYGTTDIYWMLVDDIVVTEELAPIVNYQVSFVCTGTGSGSVSAEEINATSLCGLNFDVSDGDSLTLAITPGNCSWLEHFYVNNVDKIDNLSYYASGSSIRVYVLKPTETTTVQAVFSKTVYNVNATAEPDYMGTVEGTGPCNCGSTATLTAVPASDSYRFVRWMDNNTDNPRTVSVYQDINYIAYFESVEGVNEAEKASVAIYPNPSNGNVFIAVDEPATISIIDVNGRTVAYSASEHFEASGLSAGIYIIKISTKNNNIIKKLIVK